VDVRRIDDPAEFLARAGPLLLQDEARHNLILGIAATLREHPDFYPTRRLWLAESETAVHGAALRTPPHNLVLARPVGDAAVDALAEAVADDDDPPGLVAAVPEVDAFLAAWERRTGRTPARRRSQGIYALEHVESVPRPEGRPRDADTGDEELACAWWRDFAIEALGDAEPDERQVAHAVRHRLEADGWGIALWELGDRVVSLAGFGGQTPNGIRIGPVYTPPELRGHGYATALVADLGAKLLASGRRFCFLYTDLANPISNRIYERIGYEWVCESAEVVFDAAR
jgi:GNAT superfamily N-acetyltransferase